MTNPLFKVTLALLSLISAVLIAQSLLGVGQQSSAMQTDMNNGVVVQQQSANTTEATVLSLAAARVNLLKQPPSASSEGTQLQLSNTESQTPSDTAANRQQPNNQVNRRAFSFHYLDILEWMFAGRNDKAKHQQPQRPSTSFSAG